MPKLPSKAFETLKAAAKDKAAGINTESLKEKAVKAGEALSGKAGEIKESAIAAKEDIAEKLTEEEFNDPKKADIFKKKLNRKLIQYYCMENMEKNKFKAPSERTINKLQQFKK